MSGSEHRAPMGTAAHARPRAARGRTSSAETPLTIIAPGVPASSAFRGSMRRRAGFRLGKFAHDIGRVTVRLNRISGPKGRPAFRCRVKLVLPGVGATVAEKVARAPQDAFDRAIDAAERAVRRVLNRRRQARRRGSG